MTYPSLLRACRQLLYFCTLLALGMSTSLAKPIKLSFLYLPVADYAPVFVAKEKGYFKELGLDVDLVPKDATAETVPLLASGNVLAGGSSWGAGLFNALNSGVGVTVVGQLARIPESGRSPVHFMVAGKKPTTGETDLAGSLKGRRIGVLGAGALTVYLAAEVHKSHGLQLSEIEMINLPMHTFGQAFANDSIQAGIVFEPFASGFEEQGIAHSAVEGFSRGTEMGFIAFNSEFLKKNEEAVVGFMTAFLRAARELKDGGWSQPEIQAILKKYTKLNENHFSKIGYTEVDPQGRIDLESVREQEAFFMEQENLIYKTPIDLSKHYREDISQKAAQRLDRKAS